MMTQENYCHDEATNAYWNDLKTRTPDHSDVIAFYKLCIQVCKQVDDGELNVNGATEQFEQERKRVVDALERGQI